MARIDTRWAWVLLVLMLAGCTEGDLSLQADEGPCLLEVHLTGVELTSDRAGTVPDVGTHLVRAGDGRFFTSTNDPGIVAVWSSEGEFLASVGNPGPGPEEFGTVRALSVDSQDRVHVLHSNTRWSLITSDLGVEPVATQPGLMHASSGNAALVGDSMVVVAGHDPGAPELQLHTVHAEEGTVASYRRLSMEYRAWMSLHPSVRWFREPGVVWTGPWQSSPHAYTLEQWSTDGELLQTVTREAEWLQEEPVGEDGTGPVRATAFDLQRFSDGLAYVSMRIPDPDEVHQDGRTLRFDLIDLVSGEVLASGRRRGSQAGEPTVLTSVFPGSGLGYRMEYDDAGLATAHILELELRPGPETTDERCSLAR